MRYVFGIMVAWGTIVAIPHSAKAEQGRITSVHTLPPQIKKTADGMTTNIDWLIAWKFENNGRPFYRLLGKDAQMHNLVANVAADAQPIDVRTHIRFQDVPEAARNALKARLPQFTPTDGALTTSAIGLNDRNVLFYRVEGTMPGNNKAVIQVGPDGKRLEYEDGTRVSAKVEFQTASSQEERFAAELPSPPELKTEIQMARAARKSAEDIPWDISASRPRPKAIAPPSLASTAVPGALNSTSTAGTEEQDSANDYVKQSWTGTNLRKCLEMFPPPPSGEITTQEQFSGAWYAWNGIGTTAPEIDFKKYRVVVYVSPDMDKRVGYFLGDTGEFRFVEDETSYSLPTSSNIGFRPGKSILESRSSFFSYHIVLLKRDQVRSFNSTALRMKLKS